MSVQLDQMIAYYVSRLIYQYRKPKAQAETAIIVKQLLIDGLPMGLADAFNPNTAVGKQLDIIGKYVGIPRTIGDPAPAPFFGFVDYVGANPQNMNGVNDYLASLNPNVLFYDYTYSGTRNTALTDSAYAFMIALKIILNSNDGTLYGIQQYLKSVLPGFVTVTDNKDMTMTYTVSTAAPVAPGVLQPYLPKPMGVGVNIVLLARLITDGGDEIVTDTGDHIVVDLGS